MSANFTIKALFSVCLILYLQTNVKAQVATSYVFSASTSPYTILTGGTEVTAIETDDASVRDIPLGFNFNYNGTVYTQASVSSNGWLSFANINPSAANGRNNNLRNSGGISLVNVLAPLWDDLNGDIVSSGLTSSIASYLTSGTAGSRVFTFEWRNWKWNYAAANAVISFQVKLYEGSNIIEFRYSQGTTAVNSGSASIGISGAAGDYLSLNNTSASPTASSTAETTTLSIKPATNQVYTFTPLPLVTINTTGTHPTAGFMNTGSSDNMIASYKVITGATALTPSSFQFNTGGTYVVATDIVSYKLYSNTTNSLTGSPTLVQTITATNNPQTLVFNTGFTVIPANTTIYYIIAVDVAATAEPGRTIYITNTALSNFVFDVPVVRMSDNSPALASNVQTVKVPQVTITAAHYPAVNMDQGSVNNIIASYKMDFVNDNITPTSFTFTTTGSYIAGTDISNFKLYMNNGNNLNTPTLIGTVTASSNPQSITFNSGFPTLADGSSWYFILTADVPLSGLNGDDISVVSNNLSNFNFTSASSVPVVKEGTNPATAGNTFTIYGPTVAITAAHNIAGDIVMGTTDNIVAAYQLDVNNAVSVTPSSLTLTTAAFANSYLAGDLVNFKLYQNTAVTLTGATLVSSVTAPGSGSSVTFNSGSFQAIPSAGTSFLIITADVGAITASNNRQLRFTSTPLANFSFVNPGGSGVQKTGTNPVPQSNLQTIRQPQITVSTVHPIAGSILTGSQNNLIVSYKLVSNYGTITPLAITVTTGGSFQGASDISKFNLYQNTSNSLTGATLAGTVTLSGTSGTNILTFNTDPFTAIPVGTTSYLLVVADVAGTATAGRTVNIISTTAANPQFTFTSPGSVPVLVLGNTLAASNNQTVVSKLDIYSSGVKTWDVGTVNWGGTTGGPYNNYVWIASGIGQLEGTGGLITIGATPASLPVRKLTSTVNNYQLISSSNTNGITFTSPAEFNVTTGTTVIGNGSNNAVIYGNNGLTKTGTGELQIMAPFGSSGAGFTGDILVNQGTLTLGSKTSNSTYNASSILKGSSIYLNNANLVLAGRQGSYASLQNLTSFVSTGVSKISLYQNANGGGYYPAGNFMHIQPVTGTGSFASQATPLIIGGQLTVDNAGYTGVSGSWWNVNLQNSVDFGNTSYTGNTTFIGYSNQAELAYGSGTMININLGGFGHYMVGVGGTNGGASIGSIKDNGYSTTFYGGGGAVYDGAQLLFNSASSSMTGDWIVGKSDGTEAGWIVTNTTTCLTRGNITVNNFSKACLQLTSTSDVNISYSPGVINLYGLGPGSQDYPSALDFYNFSGANAGKTILPCDITLNPVFNSNVASIGSQVGGLSTDVTFILNGRLSGEGGLEKTGPGVIVLNTQNISGNYNTYLDTTRIRNGTLTVNSGSNMGTGPLHMYQLYGANTTLNLNNAAQTVSSLTSTWNNQSGQAQIINLNSTILTVNQNVNTTFGNGTGTSVGYIAGTGHLIKDGTGTLTLTGACTYTGYTQVKNGTLQLNRTNGGTLPPTSNVHIIGGKLKISSNQELTNLILSSGTLEIDNGVTLLITGSLTMVPTSANIILSGSGNIVYGPTGRLIYAGNTQQITSTKELPTANGPKNIIFNNYSSGGVQLNTDITLTNIAGVAGWLDFNGKKINGSAQFILNGLNNKTPKGSTTAGSNYLTNLGFTGSLEIGMSVTGPGIPADSYIIYIDPLVSNSVTINNNATATASNVTFDMNLQGGLLINLPGGIDAHVAVSGTKTYNSGANYIFKTPTTGNQIYPAFPTVGILNYSPAYDVSIQAGTANRVVMGNSHDLEISHDLKLTTGVFVTNNNLITWSNSGGILTSPEATYTANSLNYTNSFIATCDLNGVPLNVASATSAFAGTKGFKIRNVSNTDTYFPVGPSYLTAGTAVATASPNRMMINNQSGSPQDYTVVVNYGDIGYTNGGGGSWRVNRIWYVKSSAATGKATMRLFFTKRNWVNWGTGENEVEAGFVYAKPAFVQKDYSGGYGNFINLSGTADITDFTSNALYPYDREVYAQYTIGVSNNLTNGIEQFNRFSIVNPNAIILPVSVVNLKAYKVGDKVRIDWTALNETGIDHYEIEKSTNAITFNGIGIVKAYNNGNARNDYYFTDNNPVSGKNFYRIKIYDKDSRTSTTIIVVVNIENGKTSITVMPNPVKNKTMVVAFNNIPAGKYEAILYNVNGQKVYQRVIEHIGGSASQTMNLPASLSSGSYILRVLNETTNFSARLFVE